MTFEALAALATTAAAPEANDTYLLWGGVLFGLAVVMIVIELFIPSGGLLGIVAGVAAIGSVIAFFSYDTAWGVGVLLAYMILIPMGVAFFFKYWLSSPIGRRMILGGETDLPDREGTAAVAEQARRERLSELTALIGVEGVTETSLRPVGTVRIEGQRIDALAESGIIEANVPIVVTDAYDNQIKVREKR